MSGGGRRLAGEVHRLRITTRVQNLMVQRRRLPGVGAPLRQPLLHTVPPEVDAAVGSHEHCASEISP